MKALETNISIAGSVTQKEKEFQRPMSISLLQTIMGSIKLPNLPISTGITAKKIITKA